MRDNILSASVPISLDGQEYELRYHAYAFIEYADKCGGDLLHDLRQLGEGLRGLNAGQETDSPVALAPLLVKVRDLLWAGLIEAHPELTRADVGRLFGFADLGALAPVIMQALTRTLPEASKTPARPTKAPNRRDSRLVDGLASGPSSAIAAGSAPASSNP
jgi:hypothetical protein